MKTLARTRGGRGTRETGLGVLSALLLLILVGAVVLIGFRVVPIYIEYYQIRKALATIGEDIDNYGIETTEIRRRMERHFAIDYISAVKPRDLRLRKQQGMITVDLDYEDRRPLFGNLQVVGRFNESIQLYP
jgi:hypothetical protein